MGKPEGTIENYLKKLCDLHNFLYYKFTSPANSGVPDRIIIGNGQTVFVELKRPGARPRALQEAVFSAMKKRGAIVYVIDTKPKADKLIKKLDPNFKKKKTRSVKTNFVIKSI